MKTGKKVAPILVLISILSLITYCLLPTRMNVGHYVVPNKGSIQFVSKNNLKDLKEKCHDDIDTVIVVRSLASNFANRRITRSTYGDAEDQKLLRFQLFFAQTYPNADAETMRKVSKENAKYRDILHFGHHPISDTLIMKWVSHYCDKADFLILANDDVYVNVYNLFDNIGNLKNLSRLYQNKFIFHKKKFASNSDPDFKCKSQAGDKNSSDDHVYLVSAGAVKDLYQQSPAFEGVKTSGGTIVNNISVVNDEDDELHGMRCPNMNSLIENLMNNFNCTDLSLDIRKTFYVGHSLDESDMNIIHNYVKRYEYASIYKVCQEMLMDSEWREEEKFEETQSEENEKEEEEEQKDGEGNEP